MRKIVVLDTYPFQPEEPPLVDHLLSTLENCVITPHIAWAGKVALVRLLDITRANLAAFLQGQPQNVIS